MCGNAEVHPSLSNNHICELGHFGLALILPAERNSINFEVLVIVAFFLHCMAPEVEISLRFSCRP